MLRRAGSVRMVLSPGRVAAYADLGHDHDLIWYQCLSDSADPFHRME